MPPRGELWARAYGLSFTAHERSRELPQFRVERLGQSRTDIAGAAFASLQEGLRDSCAIVGV